jgi:ribosomal protein L11 methylase PrmA
MAMTNLPENPLSSSFRDPNGFLFLDSGQLYRQINNSYRDKYQKLVSSGLYDKLVTKGLLVAHQETSHPGLSNDSYLVIQPERVPFISYPYEWSFSQLKDAALLTLTTQMEALRHGMVLKDASAYNVQFRDDKPVFIDTLSFDNYQEGAPWVAYRQFCQHFLAPLALMSYTDIRLNKLLINYIDGIPLDLASTLLPTSSKFSLSLILHIHLHSRRQIKSSEQSFDKAQDRSAMPIKAMVSLIDNLRNIVKKLDWTPKDTEWHDYYISNNNYEGESLSQKEQLVSEYISQTQAQTVWDLGANDGRFSRIAAKHAKRVISWDIDPACVEINYLSIRKNQEKNILPLLIDLTNPSPAIGWANQERDSFMQRGPCDTLLALGLIHHLAISNNLPLHLIADSFRKICSNLILEFVPKEDSQVVKLLKNRSDIFPLYCQQEFESVFSQFFTIDNKQIIYGTVRTLYLMKVKC